MVSLVCLIRGCTAALLLELLLIGASLARGRLRGL